ncbi:MAG: hypothetical protein RLZZ290_1421 [Pseudomonadota bacterium]
MAKAVLAWHAPLGATLFFLAFAMNAPSIGAAPLAQVIHQKACAACHGLDANAPVDGVPSLAGQPAVFIETQLVYIREGLRDVPAMREVAKGLSDSEMTQLGRWYATLPAKTQSSRFNAAAFTRGQVLAKQALCGTCHMPNYQGQQQVPRLSSQREDYLQVTLRLMRDGKAAGRDTIMTTALEGLDNQALDDLAHYFANRDQPGNSPVLK